MSLSNQHLYTYIDGYGYKYTYIYLSTILVNFAYCFNISKRRIKFLAGLHLLTVLFNTYFIMSVEFKMRMLLRRPMNEITSTATRYQLRFFALYDYVFFHSFKRFEFNLLPLNYNKSLYFVNISH